MKTKILITAVILLVGLVKTQAQRSTNKETKIVLVVNEKTNSVTNLALADEIKDLKSALKKYPSSKFFEGSLRGKYVVVENGFRPKKNATVTMFTNRPYLVRPNIRTIKPKPKSLPGDQFKKSKTSKKSLSPKKDSAFPGDNFLPGDQFFPGDQFLPGDQFDLGGSKAEVISSKKGVLILKAR